MKIFKSVFWVVSILALTSCNLGNLLADFDFGQTPRSPLVLSTNPPPGPASIP